MKRLLILILVSILCLSVIGCDLIPPEIANKLGIATDSQTPDNDGDTVTDKGGDTVTDKNDKPTDNNTPSDKNDTSDGSSDHTHNYTAKVTKPTCAADGYTTHVCTCGHSYTDTPTAALGHKPDSSCFEELKENGGGFTVRAACAVCSKGYDIHIDEISDFTLTKENKSTVEGLTGNEVYIPAAFTSGGKWYRIVKIGEKAFYNNMDITSVVIPNTVTSITDSAFYGCVKMNSVTLPDGLTEIGSSAFHFCSSITSIALPSSLVTIGNSAFFNCTSLRDLVLPEKLVTIGDNAFKGCSNIKKAPIPASVKTIGKNAFMNCGITSFIGGAGLESVGEGAYSGCKINTVFFGGTKEQFKAINFESNNSSLTSPAGPTFYYSETKASGCWRYVNGSPTPW